MDERLPKEGAQRRNTAEHIHEKRRFITAGGELFFTGYTSVISEKNYLRFRRYRSTILYIYKILEESAS